MKAIWKGIVIAKSENTIVIEDNHYFPPSSVRSDLLQESPHRSTCPWKGEAHYFDIVIDGQKYKRAAWTYPAPKEAAREIKDHVAFWRGVEITP